MQQRGELATDDLIRVVRFSSFACQFLARNYILLSVKTEPIFSQYENIFKLDPIFEFILNSCKYVLP